MDEKASCSTHINLDLAGEYCTLKEVSDGVNSTGVAAKPPNQTPQQISRANGTTQENNNINMSPKHKVSRSKSTPENFTVGPEGISAKQVNGAPPPSAPCVIAPGRRSTGHVKAGGRRSLVSLSNREPPPPLCYFAYLGRLAPAAKDGPRAQRGRLHSAHDILADRPVIITSTSIVSPYATDVICREFEAIEEEERRGDCYDLLDCCTCMCCVKGLFYHCTKDSKDEGKIAENPCSCKGPVGECLGRWGVMGLMSIFMPCLWCYLPFEAYFRCHKCVKKMNSRDKHKDRKAPMSSTEEPSAMSMDSRNEIVI